VRKALKAGRAARATRKAFIMAVRWVGEEDECCSDGGILVQSGRKLLLLLGRSVAGWAERFRRLAGIDRSST
jgi:hypothetical protein